MAEIVVRPFESFGPVAFDATVDEVVRDLGPPDTDFPPTASRGRELHYDQLGLQVGFDESGRVEIVESTLLHTPVLGDLRLSGRLEDLTSALEGRGFRPEEPELGYTYDFPELGLSLWREDADQEEIDSVAAWRRGYLDK